MSDLRVASPDDAVARRERLAEMRRLVNQWPRMERETFELDFVEGFEPEEFAMIQGLTPPQGCGLIHKMQTRLREALL
ncbi:MAG: hypothetical protein RMN51_00030 [Verrucomicrobiota bacterium]|nr:hypothetical protein [Limisphaera sp.]MDW8380492.1 hypothetical protein [Verrucomicrobiota bacterium]